jgi:hypothetical protein
MGSAASDPSALPSSPATETRSTLAIVEDGVLSGLIGAFVVAAWFFLFDAARGKPFFTPSLLGSVLFTGKSVEEVTSVDPTMVFAYTGLHVFLFLLAGIVIAWMVSIFEQNPQFGLVILLLFLLFEAVVFGFEVAIVPDLVGVLGAWAVGLANLFAATAMFWFLLRRRPRAMARLREAWNE